MRLLLKYYQIAIHMNKNLYFDIATEAKFKKIEKKYKHKPSKIIRMWAASPTFDAQVEELNSQLGE